MITIASALCLSLLIAAYLRDKMGVHSTGGTGWYKGGYKEYPGVYLGEIAYLKERAKEAIEKSGIFNKE